MNDHSSRSHAILILHVSQVKKGELQKSSFYLCDLAGCEQIKKTKVEGVHRLEAIEINTALTCLGKVIGALVERRSHVP